jgi:DNA-binding CsgD family transcriptional regulator
VIYSEFESWFYLEVYPNDSPLNLPSNKIACNTDYFVFFLYLTVNYVFKDWSGMTLHPYKYSIFFDFIEAYLPSGFLNVNAADAIMQKLEEVTEENNQFFTASDMTQLKYLFVSKRSMQMIGVAPEQIDPGTFMEITHPDDLPRLGLVRVEMIKLAQEIHAAKKGSALMSFTLRWRVPDGGYNNFLAQAYFFYTKIPYEAIFLIQVGTKIDWFKMSQYGSHFYNGKDISLFRFPDEKLLKIGHNLTNRELEIIKLIETGLSSNQIAEKLFLSINTVNTHRSNILEKLGKLTISDVIFDLKNRGLL